MEVKDLGVKNGAHRAKIVSSLRILKEKYERGRFNNEFKLEKHLS